MSTSGSNTSRRWRERSTRRDWLCSELKTSTETRTKVIVEVLSRLHSAQATILYTLLMATATGLLINQNQPLINPATVTLSLDALSVLLLESLTTISNCKGILPMRIKEIIQVAALVKKRSSLLLPFLRCAPRNTRSMRKKMRKKQISNYLVVATTKLRKLYCQLTEAVLSSRRTPTLGLLRV